VKGIERVGRASVSLFKAKYGSTLEGSDKGHHAVEIVELLQLLQSQSRSKMEQNSEAHAINELYIQDRQKLFEDSNAFFELRFSEDHGFHPLGGTIEATRHLADIRALRFFVGSHPRLR